MKQRFSALDLKASLFELSRSFIGLRVANVYDIDHKTYLIKFTKPDDKAVILIESGIRIHSTSYDWPKNVIPSGFSMKMRKHLRSRRLEKICQLGIDRIVDMQFGSGEAAYHLIVELYDKGNILLTDYEYIILSVLRPRTDADADVRFAVREKYPLQTVKSGGKLTIEKLKEILANAKENDDLKKFLTSNLMFGTAVIDHCLQIAGYPDKCLIGKQFNKENDSEIDKLFNALLKAEEIFDQADKTPSKGYIVQKKTKAAKIETTNQADIAPEEVLTYEEFHPFLFKKHELSALYVEYESFDKAVDEFFSKLESQKLELKVLQQNKEAIKKLENVKKDHEKRIEDLQKSQKQVENSAKIIENNLELVDRAIFLVNNAVANQLDWSEINEIIDEAKEQNHPVASAIKELKLDINHIVVLLRNTENEEDPDELIPIQIDLGLTAYKNAKKFYDQKKQSVAKEQKTIYASDKALKSAEKKTLETLKQVKKNVAITKSRKLYWFEKFYWFISSENYLIIGGRDQQQNEIIVKRHLKPGDLYVHADLHGASSIVIKNPTGAPVPPKTLNEAGCMAVCYSVAWEAKVIANAYWVYHDQVSKQAPTGEYLSTGSFMIRGKKNFLPQTTMIFGFSLLYKLEESSVARHENERKVKAIEDEKSVIDEDEEVEDAATNAEIDNMLKELEKTEDPDEEDEKESEIINQADIDVQVKQDKDDENKKDEDDEDDDEESQFPDTSFSMSRLISNNDEDLTEKVNKSLKLEDNNEGENKDNRSSKAYVSKKQRRDMKKGKGKEGQAVDSSAKVGGSEKLKEEEVKEKADKSEPSDDDEDNEEETEEKEEKEAAPVAHKPQPQQKQQPLKRGQKAKLAKIKQKYKDQDEEDREFIMQHLQPAGKNKSKTESKKQQANDQKSKKQQPQKVAKEPPKKILQAPSTASAAAEGSEKPVEEKDQDEVPDNEDEESGKVQDEINIINTLTGIPVNEDELLFCIPMCAPYAAVQNYKHKVKMIPGTTKKGQAIKTAVEIFVRDKLTTQHEKDLIRALKDQDLSKNLPGKVKVSAPNLMKVKRKK